MLEAISAGLDRIVASYNLLPMDATTFRLWAQSMHGQSDARYENAMIAAATRRHGFTVVTRKVGDFKTFAVPVLDRFTSAVAR